MLSAVRISHPWNHFTCLRGTGSVFFQQRWSINPPPHRPSGAIKGCAGLRPQLHLFLSNCPLLDTTAEGTGTVRVPGQLRAWNSSGACVLTHISHHGDSGLVPSTTGPALGTGAWEAPEDQSSHRGDCGAHWDGPGAPMKTKAREPHFPCLKRQRAAPQVSYHIYDQTTPLSECAVLFLTYFLRSQTY